MSSIDHFIYLWKDASYDRIECTKRDSDDNPTEIRYYRKGKVILKVFISYDDNGNWTSISSEKPKKSKKKTAKGYT